MKREGGDPRQQRCRFPPRQGNHRGRVDASSRGQRSQQCCSLFHREGKAEQKWEDVSHNRSEGSDEPGNDSPQVKLKYRLGASALRKYLARRSNILKTEEALSSACKRREASKRMRCLTKYMTPGEPMGHSRMIKPKTDARLGAQCHPKYARTGGNSAGRGNELIGHQERVNDGPTKASVRHRSLTKLIRLAKQMKSKKHAKLAPFHGDDADAGGKGASRDNDLIGHLESVNARLKRASVRSLLLSLGSNESADELLAVYEGREGVLVRLLEVMKAGHVRVSILSLIKSADSLNIAEGLLAGFGGRDDLLVSYLSNLKERHTRALVRSLARSVGSRRSAEELLVAYKGEEDLLVWYLQRARGRQLRALAISLMKGLDPEKSKELLATYEGREGVLVQHLERARARRTKASAISLMRKANLDWSARERLLAAYDGREDALLSHLRRLERMLARDKVRSLAEIADVGRSADQLLAAYDGKEDVLIGHLERLSTIKEKASNRNSSCLEDSNFQDGNHEEGMADGELSAGNDGRDRSEYSDCLDFEIV